jgi:hypothetical protein
MNTSTAMSGSMWLSPIKPITLRPVRSSIARLQLEGAAAVTQTLQATPPRGKTLDQLWERGNGDGAGTP